MNINNIERNAKLAAEEFVNKELINIPNIQKETTKEQILKYINIGIAFAIAELMVEEDL